MVNLLSTIARLGITHFKSKNVDNFYVPYVATPVCLDSKLMFLKLLFFQIQFPKIKTIMKVFPMFNYGQTTSKQHHPSLNKNPQQKIGFNYSQPAAC